MKAVILGAGRMGRRHIQVARRVGLDVLGVFDIDREALHAARHEHNLVDHMLFDDPCRMFASVEPECAVIATTADSHCALTCLAADLGARYVLVEKPMAVSLADCDRMIGTCQRRGAKLGVNHQMRFMEQYRVPQQLFATAAFGELASMTVVAGNFGLAMNGTHYFEAFHFLVGEAAVEVSAWFSPGIVPNPRGARFEDRAGCVRAVTATGKRLYMDASADQGHGVRVTYAGRNGMVTVDELSGELVATERIESSRELPTTRYGPPAVKTERLVRPAEVIEASAAALQALLEETDSVSGEDGRRAVQLLVAAYQSAEQQGVSVCVDARLEEDRVFPWA